MGDVFNVGSGKPQSINTLVSLLEGPVEYIPKRPGEPDCTHADIQKIKSKLNWAPHISFSEGVQRMINHIDYWKNAPVWDADSIQVATKDWFNALQQ